VFAWRRRAATAHQRPPTPQAQNALQGATARVAWRRPNHAPQGATGQAPDLRHHLAPVRALRRQGPIAPWVAQQRADRYVLLETIAQVARAIALRVHRARSGLIPGLRMSRALDCAPPERTAAHLA
jgi:hypothetical protein